MSGVQPPPRTGLPQLNGAEKARFHDFVVACGRPLVRTAYLLTDDWDEAEFLLERALARTFQHWTKVEESDPTGTTLRSLIRLYVDTTRGRRRRSTADAQAQQTATWRAVRELSPAERTALVLRLHGGLSQLQTAGVMGLPQERVAQIVTGALIRIAEKVGVGVEIKALRAVESELRAEMAERVSTLPPAPARYALVEQRAVRNQRVKLLAAAVAVLLIVAGGSVVRDRIERLGGVAADASRPSLSPQPSASSQSPSPPAGSPSAAPPSRQLQNKLVVDGRLVDVQDGAADTVVELGAGSWTVLTAPSAYVARRGPLRKAAPVLLVKSGKATQLEKRTGSVAVNPERDWVAYTEVDADGAAKRLVVVSLSDGAVVKSIDAPESTTAVRGFVGDAVLLSHLEDDKEQARRWNTAANSFTDLGGDFGDVPATHAEAKLALLGAVDSDCTVVAFIEFGNVFERGRDCDIGLGGGTFSPDGELLAVGAAGGTEIVVLETEKDLPRRTKITVDHPLQEVGWDGDNALTVIVTGPADVTLVQRCTIKSGKCTTVWQPGTAAVQLAR